MLASEFDISKSDGDKEYAEQVAVEFDSQIFRSLIANFGEVSLS